MTPTSKGRCLRLALLALAAALVAAGLRLLRATWRIRIEGRVSDGPGVLAFWHGDQVALCAAPLHPRPTVLVSRSRDGEIGALAARLLGFGVVRGSTSRGGVAGAVGLLRSLGRGERVALAADGPRGPRHEARSSALRIARAAAVEVVPVAAAALRCLVLSSWDRLAVPAPFTTVVVVWGSVEEGEPLGAALHRASRRARELAEGTRAAPPAVEQDAG